MYNFKQDTKELLQQILRENAPELLWVIDCKDFRVLEIETIHELRDILADELIEKGFDEQDNINDFGRDLEGLIDMFGDLLA
ncbi:hypothetical protein [Bacillus paramobilis]|uniref:Uncharacterized protein n=1 Tax=Bacillus paramobilis TaxID=2817477 RepID=A0ABZ2VKU5_9BACI